VAGQLIQQNGCVPIHDDLVAEAQSLMKGCLVHFLTSAQRVSKNYAIVGRDDCGAFYLLVKSAANEPDREAFNHAIEALQVGDSECIPRLLSPSGAD
jgi:hypothetical protein